jgi:hypothetical protein
MKKSFLLIIVLVCWQSSKAQFVDKYGINMGFTYSNQLWNYKEMFAEKHKMDYKPGFSIFLSSEKQIASWISIRPELGYIQKGFKNNMEFITSDGEIMQQDDKNVIFHDLALNLCIKIMPFHISWNPYLALGISEEYMFAYKDIDYVETGSGKTYHIFSEMFDDYGDINATAILGLGLEVNDLVYAEIDYIPSLTKRYKSSFLDIKDNCFEARIGLNINRLL